MVEKVAETSQKIQHQKNNDQRLTKYFISKNDRNSTAEKNKGIQCVFLSERFCNLTK